VRCQVRQAGTCRQCHLGWCTLCQQEKGECDVCSAPITSTTNPGAEDGKSYTQRSKAKGMKGDEVISVNMHRLGESFVENVSDVRRRATVDGKAAAPGESLEFLAQIRGWQSEARKQRRDQLLQLNDIGLRVALTRAAGTDIFFIPEVHFAGETPEQDDERWWYQVRSVVSGVSLEGTRDRHPQVRKERRANGLRTSPITRRGDPKQPMGEESLPRKQRLSLMRMRRRELHGARASTG
jgi:hypothetical protein